MNPKGNLKVTESVCPLQRNSKCVSTDFSQQNQDTCEALLLHALHVLNLTPLARQRKHRLATDEGCLATASTIPPGFSLLVGERQCVLITLSVTLTPFVCQQRCIGVFHNSLKTHTHTHKTYSSLSLVCLCRLPTCFHSYTGAY